MGIGLLIPKHWTYLTLPWDIRGSEVSVMVVRISEAILSAGCNNAIAVTRGFRFDGWFV
jgi:hypothetical protein